jgi:hypothetical protein
MDTSIEYGNMEGENTIFQYRINDYRAIIEEVDILEKRKDELEKNIANTDEDNNELSSIKLRLIEIMNTDEWKKAKKYLVPLKVKDLNEQLKLYDSFDYKYINLTTMKPDIIDDISTRINSNNYKYYAVDKDFKMVHSYTTSELIKFTKGYSQNENYPMSIIDYIIFSKIQRDENININ